MNSAPLVAVPLRNEKEHELTKSEIMLNYFATHPEVRQRISDKVKGRVFSDEHKKRIGDALRGKCSDRRALQIQRLANVRRGQHLPEEWRKNISAKQKGRILTEEWKVNISKGKQGKPRSETVRAILSKARKQYHLMHPEIQRGLTEKARKVNIGRKRPEQGKLMMGEKNPSKRPEVKKKKSDSLKRYHIEHPEVGVKFSEHMKQLLLNENYAKEFFRRLHLKPNKKEQQLGLLLSALCPNEFRYVGDGEVILGGKCPDFININGRKQLVELFGTFWHSEKRKGHSNEEEERQRIEHFAKFGFKTLIVWENELRAPSLLSEKIMNFVKEG
jgi:G:T-mismatch repair DNA endonuclease (very short patch repair protein)